MVEKLCSFYGEKIGEANGNDYYCFPDIDKLSAAGVEQKLRANGFGYRAKYIEKSAKEIHSKGGRKWFEQLVQMNYKEAHRNLTELSGIGPKVADCICLMSLGHLEAIPVDTHIFQIAQKHYMPNLKSAKSVTGKMYNEIGDKFRDIYGPLAGWTQTMLFCADLKQFQAGNDAKKAIKRKATWTIRMNIHSKANPSVPHPGQNKYKLMVDISGIFPVIIIGHINKNYQCGI